MTAKLAQSGWLRGNDPTGILLTAGTFEDVRKWMKKRKVFSSFVSISSELGAQTTCCSKVE